VRREVRTSPGPYAGEGFDCPALDTLFLAALVRWKGRLVQDAGRVMRPYPGKETAEVHDYHDADNCVLAATLAGRAVSYTSLGFPDPRRITPTPSTYFAAAKDPRRAPAEAAVLPKAPHPRHD
jgi:hypothetical protein